MSDDEYRTHMTLWAMQAASLIMGHDLRATTPAALNMLTRREVIAIDQDPLGVQGRPVRRVKWHEVWRKKLADGGVAVAIFNRNSTAATVRLTAVDAGLGRVTRVRDVWPGRVVKSPLTFVVRPHGVMPLNLKGTNARLQRRSTTYS